MHIGRTTFLSLPNEIYLQILSYLLPNFPITDSPYTRGFIDSQTVTELCLVHPIWRELSQAYFFRQLRMYAVELPELLQILEQSTNKSLANSIRLVYIIFNADNDIKLHGVKDLPVRHFSREAFERDVPKRWLRIASLWRFLSLLLQSSQVLLYLALGPHTVDERKQ